MFSVGESSTCRLQLRRTKSVRGVSFYTIFSAINKILGVRGRSGRDAGIIARFEDNFLKRNLNRILGFKATYDELAGTVREAVPLHGAGACAMIGAFMLGKFLSSQAVKGGLGIII